MQESGASKLLTSKSQTRVVKVDAPLMTSRCFLTRCTTITKLHKSDTPAGAKNDTTITYLYRFCTPENEQRVFHNVGPLKKRLCVMT